VFLVALISHNSTETPLSSALEEPITNLAGIVGAYLSDIGLSFLGYSAYLIPISLIWLGYKIHKNAGRKPTNPNVTRVRFVATIVLIVSFSTLLARLFSTGTGPAGGDIGNILHNYFGALFGSMSIIVYLGIIMISAGIAGSLLWKNVFALIARLFAKLKVKRAKAKVATTTTPRLTAKKSGLFGRAKPAKKKPVKKKTNASLPNNKTLTGLPDLSLLDDIKVSTKGYSEKEIAEMSQQVEIKLKDFGFDVNITAVTQSNHLSLGVWNF
jgi:S-DNA-T family DNA segregation ATPase FtsK/SpoIIIE